MKNKLISIVTALAISFSLVPFSAFAENQQKNLPAPAISVRATGETQITVQWKAVEGAQSYTVYVKNPQTGKFREVRETDKLGVRFSNLKENTEYTFAVKANGVVGGQRVQSGASVGSAVTGAGEILFILAGIVPNPKYAVIEGFFVDSNGFIKEFALDMEDFPPVAGANQRDLNVVGNEIAKNYDTFIKIGKDTSRKVNINELEKQYTALKSINIKSNILITYDIEDDEKGFANYYGIRRSASGELEAILLKGRGDINYDNLDKNVEGICEWLVEEIPFTNYEHARYAFNYKGLPRRVIGEYEIYTPED
ncbi:MAG: fibronectin type III domain-containing protein [Oscillospiraceae bacterium]|nr:fibronectin type III domain-containing protein [Oscillospiraceae bacterium]